MNLIQSLFAWLHQNCVDKVEVNQLYDDLTKYKLLEAQRLALIAQKDESIVNLTGEVEVLKSALIKPDKHDSLESFKKYIDSIPAKTTYYNFGKGKKRVHLAFKNSLKNETIIKSFIEEDLKFDGSIHKDADTMVFYLRKKFKETFPTKRYYASDTELYGMIEYWASAKETITKLRKGVKSFDCDDVMVLLHNCIYHILKDYFPKDTWRIRGFIVDLWGNLGGHAMLAWVKEGVNDWVVLETTYMDVKQSFIWNKNYTIRNQLLYQIRYSFNHENEYVKI